MIRESISIRLVALFMLGFSFSACSDFSTRLLAPVKTNSSSTVDIEVPAQPSPAPTPKATPTQEPVADYLYDIPVCDELVSQVNTGVDSTSTFQSCLNSLPAGGVLNLPRGVYQISGTLKLEKPVTLSTLGKLENSSCELSESHSCAELRATNDAIAEGGFGLLSILSSGVSVRNIVLNGNKEARYQSQAANACRAYNNGPGTSSSINASSVTFKGNVVKNTLCGTALVIIGGGNRHSKVRIENNIFASNGVHNQEGLWADGVTVHDAGDTVISDNTFIDNTDVGLIFGGCVNCVVQNNRIMHSDSFSGSTFAALMFHSWSESDAQGNVIRQSTPGDFSGTDVSGNTIDCGLMKRCGVGLLLGGEPWYSGAFFGGFYHHNTIRNAMTGLMIDKPSATIRIQDNIVTDAGGNFLTSAGMRNFTPYAVGDFNHVQIEDTVVPRASYALNPFRRAIPNWHSRDSVPALTSKQTNIRRLFNEILGRDADYASLMHYDQSIKNSGSLETIRQSLLESEEYRRRQIREHFVSLLGREPSAADLSNWSGQMAATSHGVGRLSQELRESAERRARAQSFYRTYLNREASSDEISYWLNTNLPMSSIESGIAGSDEALDLRVRSYYQSLLGRSAENVIQDEITHWVSQIREGKLTAGEVRARLAYSRESKANLNAVYQELLGRPIDITGLNVFTAHLAIDQTLADVRNAVVQSQEYQSRSN